jgi:hypothetical protein
MRTSQRAMIAIVLALGALVVASVASASPPSPAPAAASEPTSAPAHQSDGGGGMAGGTCVIGVPDCNDANLGDPGGDPWTGEPQVVEPTPGMDNVRPTAIDTTTIGDDDTTLTILFWSGVEPCYVLDHVAVTYGAGAVTVTLFQGSDPNGGDVACIDIALQKQVTIPLDEPLAGRAIADGAA